MLNVIQLVHEFNSKAGLLEPGYNDSRESAYPIEESLEGLSDLPTLARLLGTSDPSPKAISRLIVGIAHNGTSLSDVDRLDKACDTIVFALGAMAKLGLTPAQIDEALTIVMDANLQKLGMPKDDQGKLMKPADFVPPETLLEELLARR